MKKKQMSRMLLLMVTTGCSLGAGASTGESSVSPFANTQGVAINQRQLITSVVSRNGQALFARLQRQVAMGEIDQQRGVLQSEVFTEGRYSDTEVLNSASDKLSSFQKRDQDVFEETSAEVEAGVRVPVMTGAELVLSWSGTQRENNLIDTLPGNTDDDDEEFVASLNLSIRQPLLKGFGNRVVDSRIREAELQNQVVEQEFHERLLRASSDALRVYWRLHLAARFIEIEKNALGNAMNIMDETTDQVRAGRQPRTALLEAEARVLASEVAVYDEELRWSEAQTELKTLLSLPSDEFDRLTFVTTDQPETDPFPVPLDFQAYAEPLLAQWPGYQSAILRRDIQVLEILRAEEENRNQLDLVTGYRTSGVGDRASDTFDQSYKTDYPTWYVGLEFSMPLGTNLTKRGALTSAEARKRQADVALRDVRVSVINDLRNRLTQIEVSHGNLTLAARNREIYAELFDSERQRYSAGKGRLRELFEREDERIQSQKRYSESLARFQLAIVALQLAEGSLFKRYGIRIGETVAER